MNVEDNKSGQRQEDGQREAEPDPLSQHSSDKSRMILVSAPLTDTNYLAWYRSVTLPLKAKDKLEFINDAIRAPAVGTPDYVK